MRRLVPLLLIPTISLCAVWAVSCQESPRDVLPVRNYDLAPQVYDFSAPPPDLRPADSAASDGGSASDGGMTG